MTLIRTEKQLHLTHWLALTFWGDMPLTQKYLGRRTNSRTSSKEAWPLWFFPEGMGFNPLLRWCSQWTNPKWSFCKGNELLSLQSNALLEDKHPGGCVGRPGRSCSILTGPANHGLSWGKEEDIPILSTLPLPKWEEKDPSRYGSTEFLEGIDT